VRVMVVHRGLLSHRDDVAEIEQHLVGMLHAAALDDDGFDVVASDGHDVFRPVLRDDSVEYVRVSSFHACLASRRPDVVYVHMPVPLIHLYVSTVLRLVGSRVVFAPMAMLERPYARSSWFRRRGRVYGWAKRAGVSLLRSAWRGVTDWYVCLSAEEIRETALAPERCLIVPWAVPSSGLGGVATAGREHTEIDAATPVAFVSRLDVNRKGIDRLCTWLLAHEDELPHPAVVLFAPRAGDEVPHDLDEARRRGLLTWDDTTRGSALAPALGRCRGMMLLSRWEAQARAMREAMLLGLPTLAARPCHLEEAMAVVGAGQVVDGDDVDAVQRSFEQLLDQRGDAVVAGVLFDRDRIGSFLHRAFVAVGRGEEPACRDAYLGVAGEARAETNETTAGAAA
jgi:glycosyltransferase involved in cell wall biosynthesis